ncbi:MAG: polymer-forming cytoskeletal protein [Deltaproteobacteria bacterium]|nr:polymer-forming cytoskeletal protein [Deltaproteobacteria bacterium]
MAADEKTVIGAATRINGSVETDEQTRILGRVEGSLISTALLIVEDSGELVADVAAAQVQVSGLVVGNITARELIQIDSKGRVVGDLRAPRIVLQDGATLRGAVEIGEVEVGDLETAQSEQRVAERPVEPTNRQRPARSAPRSPRPPSRVEPIGRVPSTRPSTREASEPANALGAGRQIALASRTRRGRRAGHEGGDVPASESISAASIEVVNAPDQAGDSTRETIPRPPTTAGQRTRVKRK